MALTIPHDNRFSCKHVETGVKCSFGMLLLKLALENEFTEVTLHNYRLLLNLCMQSAVKTGTNLTKADPFSHKERLEISPDMRPRCAPVCVCVCVCVCV